MVGNPLVRKCSTVGIIPLLVEITILSGIIIYR